MKKNLTIIAIVLLCASMVLVSGCTSNKDLQSENEKLKQTVTDLQTQVADLQDQLQNVGVPNGESTLITATTTNPTSERSWTKLSSFDFDYDLDGTEETLTLYTTAERDDKGNLMWDDGQEWLLLLKDGTSYYSLFKQYVQLGSVFFTVTQGTQDSVPRIDVIETTAASFRITDIAYDAAKNAYASKQVYDSGELNRFFTSMPDYQ